MTHLLKMKRETSCEAATCADHMWRAFERDNRGGSEWLIRRRRRMRRSSWPGFCPGHPRLSSTRLERKTWMPATGAGMTDERVVSGNVEIASAAPRRFAHPTLSKS
jgi:hypothetical protein